MGSAPTKDRKDEPASNAKLPIVSLSSVDYYKGIPKDFSMKDISLATNNFTNPLLGEGAFGPVYKGYMTDMNTETVIPVAIKRRRSDSPHGSRNWMQEIIVLSKFYHHNVIKLIGFCNRNNELILVYEFCESGSLDRILADDSKRRNVLSWRTRLKIALQCAAGLSFLHQENYIHRDFKSANILLTWDYNVKIADFGLTRPCPEPGFDRFSSQVHGTPGYIDPEYMMSREFTTLSDMYSYGVVLLELLTGRRPFEYPDKSLANEMRPYLERQPIPIESFMDPSLEGRYDRRYALSLATIAKHCITSSYARRTSMKIIYEELENLSELLQNENTVFIFDTK